MITIYTLSYKSNDVTFYVGATKKTLKERLSGHTNLLKSINITKDDVKIEAIEVCDNSKARYIELYWIQQFKAWGFILKNKTINSYSYRTLSDTPIKYPNGVSPLEKYISKIRVLNKVVTPCDLHLLIRYDKTNRRVICCEGTYKRYLKGNG